MIIYTYLYMIIHDYTYLYIIDYTGCIILCVYIYIYNQPAEILNTARFSGTYWSRQTHWLCFLTSTASVVNAGG